MRKRIEEDKKKRGIPASDGEDEKRSGGELDRRACRSSDELESTSEKKIEVKPKGEENRKEENSQNPLFSFYPNPPNPVFSI